MFEFPKLRLSRAVDSDEEKQNEANTSGVKLLKKHEVRERKLKSAAPRESVINLSYD